MSTRSTKCDGGDAALLFLRRFRNTVDHQGTAACGCRRARWLSANAFAIAASIASIELTHPDQVSRFTERYNDGLAA
jgi:hypothetical protein